MKVLVTGGAGYIGSTVASACLDIGAVPIILDDLSAGRAEFLRDRISFCGDIADGDLIGRIFREHPDICATIHCAAQVIVAESVADPIAYYRTNVSKSVDLMEHLLSNGCSRVLLSSSAAIYAASAQGWVDEESPLGPASPYARTKAVLETALQDFADAYRLRVLSLRYFNPIGADPKLRTGLQTVSPTHVLGKLIESQMTGRPFEITGVDWPTRDGTGIRDYIHVWDLAEAHVAGLLAFDRVLPAGSAGRYDAVNLGTGRGTTVRELIAAFEEVAGCRLDVVEAPPRPGDVAGCYTRDGKAVRLLNWRSRFDIRDGIRHSLEWNRHRHHVLLGEARDQLVQPRRKR